MTQSSDKNIKKAQFGERHILYDAALIEHPDEQLFSPGAESHTKSAVGRGDALFFQHNNLNLVLKHYRRGGMAERWMGDRYLGSNPEKSRSFREWRLLRHLRQMHLPVPVPVAASVINSGIFYRADLITREIEEARPLADALLAGELDEALWHSIGQCIKHFHDNDIYHADLNARNILIDKSAQVHLIDFDKGRIRYMGEAWKTANLARLNRSLQKFKSNSRRFHYYEENDWKTLLGGYAEGPSK